MLADFVSDVDELSVASQSRLLGVREIIDLFTDFDVVVPATPTVAFTWAVVRAARRMKRESLIARMVTPKTKTLMG